MKTAEQIDGDIHDSVRPERIHALDEWRGEAYLEGWKCGVVEAEKVFDLWYRHNCEKHGATNGIELAQRLFSASVSGQVELIKNDWPKTSRDAPPSIDPNPQTSLDYFNQVETALIVLKLKSGKVLAFDLHKIPDAQQTWWLIEKLLQKRETP